jgi:(1->4)-alpha-D-glucan 1-alpha-D-glucosylmutase
MTSLGDRVETCMIKAVREGKEVSRWSNPNTEYEVGLRRFISGALDASRANPFLADFHAFIGLLARPAAITALAQLVLKLTVPGVPDIYQGGELWDFSLVDPDNRRPVDWEHRRALLREIGALTFTELGSNVGDGRAKLFIVRRLLELRQLHPELFAAGDYAPLEVTGGPSADHLCAFARHHGEATLVTAIPRLIHGLYRGGSAAGWGAAELILPAQGAWRDVLTGHEWPGLERVSVSSLLADFPVSVLLGVAE